MNRYISGKAKKRQGWIDDILDPRYRPDLQIPALEDMIYRGHARNVRREIVNGNDCILYEYKPSIVGLKADGKKYRTSKIQFQ